MNELKEYAFKTNETGKANIDVINFCTQDGLEIKKHFLQTFVELIKQKLSECSMTPEQVKTFLELAEVRRAMMVCVYGLFSYCSEYSKGGCIIVHPEWYIEDLEDQGLYFLIMKYKLGLDL
jgi:hypothetical protein